MIKPYDEAPLEYRGYIIHLDDYEGCYTFVGKRQERLAAVNWPLLQAKIDTVMAY